MIARILSVGVSIFLFAACATFLTAAVACPPPAQAPGHDNVVMHEDTGFFKRNAANLLLRSCDWKITDYGVCRIAQTTSGRTEIRLIGYNGKWYRY